MTTATKAPKIELHPERLRPFGTAHSLDTYDPALAGTYHCSICKRENPEVAASTSLVIVAYRTKRGVALWLYCPRHSPQARAAAAENAAKQQAPSTEDKAEAKKAPARKRTTSRKTRTAKKSTAKVA